MVGRVSEPADGRHTRMVTEPGWSCSATGTGRQKVPDVRRLAYGGDVHLTIATKAETCYTTLS